MEIGTRGWLGAFAASGVSYDLAVYNSKVSDELIPFEIPGGAGRRYFRNAGSTLRTGVEASLATQIGMASLGLSYSYSHFRFEDYEVAGTDFADKRIPGIPIQQLQGSATFRNGAWYLVMEGETRGGVYVSDANTIRSPGYELMNARLGWDGTGRLSWLSTRVGVQNVFDRRHVTSVSVNATNGRYYEPAPGRVYFAGVTLGVVR
jgi:iron complex outermembrane receptor protein